MGLRLDLGRKRGRMPDAGAAAVAPLAAITKVPVACGDIAGQGFGHTMPPTLPHRPRGTLLGALIVGPLRRVSSLFILSKKRETG